MPSENDLQWFIEVDNIPTDSESHEGNVSYANYTAPYHQIISDRLMWHLNLYINILLCEAVAVFGTASNVVNMIVFVRLGLKDSMAVCLFNLTLSDFVLCFIVFGSRVFTVWDTFFETDVIDPMAIWYVGFGRVADSIFVCSGWITTFLALERCVCVIFPFKVKTIFTRNRSILIVIAIYLAVISTYIPLHATHHLGWITVETVNGTATKKRLVVLFSENRAQVESVLEILTGSVLTFPSVAIILVSMGLMIYGLRVSSEKRSAMTAHTTNRTDAGGDKSVSGLNSKTRRLVKVVVFLATIFTLCSLPRFYPST